MSKRTITAEQLRVNAREAYLWGRLAAQKPLSPMHRLASDSDCVCAVGASLTPDEREQAIVSNSTSPAEFFIFKDDYAKAAGLALMALHDHWHRVAQTFGGDPSECERAFAKLVGADPKRVMQ